MSTLSPTFDAALLEYQKAVRFSAAADIRAQALLDQRNAGMSVDIQAEEEASDPIYDEATTAFRAFLAFPCQSLAEVRTKATNLLLARPAFGGELEPEEMKILLRSFIGGDAKVEVIS